MSMGLSDISAEEVVNNFSEHKLKLIKILVKKKMPLRLLNIVKARSKKIRKVDQLVEIIENTKNLIIKKLIHFQNFSSS